MMEVCREIEMSQIDTIEFRQTKCRIINMHSYNEMVKVVMIYLFRVLFSYAPELIHLRGEGNDSRKLRADGVCSKLPVV